MASSAVGEWVVSAADTDEDLPLWHAREDLDPLDLVRLLHAQRDEWHRRNGLPRGELGRARASAGGAS